MRFELQRGRWRAGNVLMTTLVMALLVGLAVSALLFITRQHSIMTARARVWASEIPMAEAGMEEALAHLNSNPGSLAANGWKAVGTNFVRTRVFSNAYFHTLISSSREPVIVSVGYARVPLHTNYTRRTVVAMTRRAPPKYGVVAKGTVTMNGTSYVDSFDSSDPQFSTDGLYDFAKRRDQAGVASVSSSRAAVDTGGAKIYGYAATGPKGTVAGNVGDGAWLASYTGLQPFHVADDFNMAIPDVVLPSMSLRSPPAGGDVDGVRYSHILSGDNDYEFSSISLSSDGGILVTGRVRVYLRGDLKMSARAGIVIAPGASLEIYIAGSADVTGKGVVNGTGIAGNCLIYGLPTCRDLKLAGDGNMQTRIYAPQAQVNLSGDADISGSIVGNTIRLSGKGAVHYDEALGRNNPVFRVVSWEEM